MEKKDKIYIIDHKMKWKTFKLLHDKLVQDSGPTPVQGDKALWHLLRDRKIYCWFDEKIKGDMMLGLKLPKNKEWLVLKNA